MPDFVNSIGMHGVKNIGHAHSDCQDNFRNRGPEQNLPGVPGGENGAQCIVVFAAVARLFGSSGYCQQDNAKNHHASGGKAIYPRVARDVRAASPSTIE